MPSDQRNHMDTGVVRHFCLLNGNNEPFLLNSEAKYLKKIMLEFLPRPLFSSKLFQNSFKTLQKIDTVLEIFGRGIVCAASSLV